MLVYVLGVVHAIGFGSDAPTPWLRWLVLVTGAPILVLCLRRVTTRRPARARVAAVQPEG